MILNFLKVVLTLKSIIFSIKKCPLNSKGDLHKNVRWDRNIDDVLFQSFLNKIDLNSPSVSDLVRCKSSLYQDTLNFIESHHSLLPKFFKLLNKNKGKRLLLVYTYLY